MNQDEPLSSAIGVLGLRALTTSGGATEAAAALVGQQTNADSETEHTMSAERPAELTPRNMANHFKRSEKGTITVDVPEDDDRMTDRLKAPSAVIAKSLSAPEYRHPSVVAAPRGVAGAKTKHVAPRVSRRRGGPLRARLVAVAFLLAACGGDQTAGPPAGPVSSTTPSSSATPSSSTSASRPTSASPSPSPSAAGGWTSDGPSFGVDRTRWPTTANDAKPVLDRLPKTLAGQRLQTYASGAEPGRGATAGALYGEKVMLTVSDEYISEDTADGSRTLMSARHLIAARFGLVFACSKNSYRGNALPSPGKGFADIPAGEPVWFSCAVDGAEGDDSYEAHAAGWTSGKTAWVVVAPDSKTVRSLINALQKATA
jgi:hypothetical protein